MKTILGVLVVGLALAGCTIGPTPAERYVAALRSWKGQDINALIQRMGPPTKTYEMPNGSTMFTWGYSGPETSSGFYYGGIVTSTASRSYCALTFTVTSGGVIEHILSEGNACRVPVARPEQQPKPQTVAL